MLVRGFAAAALLIVFGAGVAEAQVSRSKAQGDEPDYANARPMDLPQAKAGPGGLSALILAARNKAPMRRGAPGSTSGGEGDGEKIPETLPASRFLPDAVVTPQQFGRSDHPFTTALEPDSGAKLHRRAGKLFFKIGRDTYVCSGSLIKPGLVVTAAHCVADFGRGFFSGFRFIPAYQKGAAPYGRYKGATAFALTSYIDGTDSCAVSGVVCENDVAVIVLAPTKGKLPGDRTGWFGYAWDGYGFNDDGQALITQLGYPVGLNHGERQERTDSQGVVSAEDSNNTVIGSMQTGGSSGGPWLVNFGIKPKANGTSFGEDSAYNTVVGTTSWGYVSNAVKEQGAAPFTAQNIKKLVETACSEYPNRC